MNDGGKLERELINLVNDRQKYLSKNPPSLNQVINQRLPEIMDSKIKPPNLGRGGVFGSYMDAINATGNTKAIKFSNQVKRGVSKIFKQKQKLNQTNILDLLKFKLVKIRMVFFFDTFVYFYNMKQMFFYKNGSTIF